ncbi:hypothetical protein CA13_50490 [Planctomycetes bacterium CA13]|uniref:Secreted protein n=1 Tax=Novipirellula herctigrandis TaxID=2527986 RepID=A0A5C5Z8G3_9BACT|nr:hypothetical protein CA13_50490 [Planctomycetes bacterium CA13]
MRIMRMLILLALVVPVLPGCGDSTEPTVTTTTDELQQFIADNPELNVTEEDFAGQGMGPAKGESQGE